MSMMVSFSLNSKHLGGMSDRLSCLRENRLGQIAASLHHSRPAQIAYTFTVSSGPLRFATFTNHDEGEFGPLK